MTADRATDALKHCHLNLLRLSGDAAPSIYSLTELTEHQRRLLETLHMSELGDGRKMAGRFTPR